LPKRNTTVGGNEEASSTAIPISVTSVASLLHIVLVIVRADDEQIAYHRGEYK
jgi:hypothetical protein